MWLVPDNQEGPNQGVFAVAVREGETLIGRREDVARREHLERLYDHPMLEVEEQNRTWLLPR